MSNYMASFLPVIKWSGSKRSQSTEILSYFPKEYDVYYEPFIGGGSMLYAANPKKAVCGDICIPLIQLWNEIKNNPNELSESYKTRWEKLQREGYNVFYEVREAFNQNNNPYDLMFLSRTCVNGLIRFNKNGDFNNSFHNTRPGISPDKLKKIIFSWNERIKNATFVAGDYAETTKNAKKGDLVYLDPPYFHTEGRYFGKIDYDKFIEYLRDLNRRGIKYILSYDGIRGDDNYMVNLPDDVYKRHVLISSGNSSFKKVMNKKNEEVFESLYLNW